MAEEKEVLGPTYDAGKPEGPSNWRHKLQTREDMLKYLQTGERVIARQFTGWMNGAFCPRLFLPLRHLGGGRRGRGR